ncbi:MAG: DUF4214 domain-containing protein [Pseudomonadota bacterium]
MFTNNPVSFTNVFPTLFPSALSAQFQQYASIDGVHVLAQSNVTAQQLTYVASVMRGLNARDTNGTVHAAMIASNATLTMFNDSVAMAAARSAIEAIAQTATGLLIQDLQANEVILPNSGINVRDATTEEVTHLIHNAGLTPSMPNFQAALQAANDAAIARQQYFPLRVSSDLPQGDYDDEYLAIGVEAFYNVRRSTDNGAHPSLTRTDLQTQDVALYNVVNSYFPDSIAALQTSTNVGTVGSDSFSNTSGSDVFDGGDGLDTIQYELARAQVTTQLDSNGRITVTGQGTDQLDNIERLSFTDGTLAFDTSGAAGNVYRLYRAAFARTPDQGGLGFWIGRADGGTSIEDIAANFINSAEFQSIYGSDSTNASFVDRLYQNVLSRTGDQGGINFWTGELDSGQRSRQQVLQEFSASPENVNAVAPTIAEGIFF